MTSLRTKAQLDRIESKAERLSRGIQEMNQLFFDQFDMLNKRVIELEKKKKGGAR